jgi:hypothetical protein
MKQTFPQAESLKKFMFCDISIAKGANMAVTKKQSKKSSSPKMYMSWKQLFIAASVAANIAFVVAIATMMTSHVLDGMFMNEGLSRYCSSDNNDKFKDTTDKVKALRAYTCASGDAKGYFDNGFKSYLDYKAITY